MTIKPYKRKSIPKKLREQVIKEQGIRCHYCGAKTTPRQRQLDHILPVAKGGLNSADNLLVSCKRCNGRKLNQDYHKFITKRIVEVELELKTLKAINKV